MRRAFAVAITLSCAFAAQQGNSDDAAMARWLAHQADYATITTVSIGHEGISPAGSVFGNAQDYSDGVMDSSTGRIFAYLSNLDPTGADLLKNPFSAVTMSEAQLNASNCAPVDPEDPTCAKLTLSGKFNKIEDADVLAVATKAIQSRHPATKSWPSGHDFYYLEMEITDIFFIDGYGGAKEITVAEYFAAEPMKTSYSKAAGAAHGVSIDAVSTVRRVLTSTPFTSDRYWYLTRNYEENSPRPIFLRRAKVARWMVNNALWGVLSTHSARNSSYPFGNSFSVSDGSSESNSTGRLFFYLTTLDPSGQDIAEDSQASFGFSEASLLANYKRGKVCGGKDPEDPTCARISFSGNMVDLTTPGHEADAALAKDALFSKHPDMQYWPAGHSFKFYELQFDTIYFLDFYGGTNTLDAKDYWAATP